MKCADFIAQFLGEQGIKNIFLVTGGAIAHMVDAVGRRSDEIGDISYKCVVHEQAGAMAAEVYSRLSGSLGVALATSGPGATNFITGICGCWFDSVPALFITGQVSSAESVSAAEAAPRQVGFQETDIVSIVKPVVKYVRRVEHARDIRRVLEEAIAIARSGRPGPVLVDVPVNIQTVDVDPAKLPRFNPRSLRSGQVGDAKFSKKMDKVVKLLQAAERPVVLLGGGVRLAGAERKARALIEKIRAPVVVSWSGFDLVPDDHPLFSGHIGVYGSRGANFTVQNADLVLSIGSRLDTRQTGGKLNAFARHAKKIMVDIDRNEIEKGRGLKIDLGIVSDAGRFIDALSARLGKKRMPAWSDWHTHARRWRKRYRYPEDITSSIDKPMNAYPFLRKLSDQLVKNDVIIADEGGNLVWTMQAFRIKEGQRLISTFGNSPMGYALPAAIGAAFARLGQRVICIDGDGGFQPNIQELQTVAYYRLPIKFFIMNNQSMGIIKQFQDAYFGGRYHASAPEHGYVAPDFVKIAKSYGIPAFSVSKLNDADRAIKRALSFDGPMLVNVMIDVSQKLTPKLEFGRPLEDMSPYLDREELKKAMIVPLLPESESIPENKGWVNLAQ